MEVHKFLFETLKQRPFNEKSRKKRFKLNSKQCTALASNFSTVLDKFFGITEAAVLTQPSSRSSVLTKSRPWKTVSILHSKRISDWTLARNKSGSEWWEEDSVFPVLDELKTATQGLEELYRVIKEAENFLITCSNADWRRAAVSFAALAEARDVHIHDLVWCIAGLKLAFNSIRGVRLASRAQFCRLVIAECYAKLETLSAGNSDLVISEEQDRDDLLSKLQKVKENYDGRNLLRRKMAITKENLKSESARFLLQKLTPVDPIKAPQYMQIRIEDLTFLRQRRLIGRGSYASVYECFWLGIKVAAKEFQYDTCKDLVECEANILADLRCPFIVQLIGWCVDIPNNTCYLVLELAKANLRNFVTERRTPLRLPVLIDSMLQISRGMEYLHSKRILHRDLKPTNILVEPLSSCKELKEQGYGRLKLCDFGSAKLKLERSTLMTSKVGTLCYMAPEVWAHSDVFGTECNVEALDRVNYSFAADVYSFSMTFAFSLTGKEPFENIKTGSALMDMLGRGLRPELPVNCPRFLKEFIQRCWSQNPSSRPSFPSISMTLRHLKLLLIEGGSPERHLKCLLDNEAFLSTPAVSYHDIYDATDGFTRRAQDINLDSIYHGVVSDDTRVLVHLKQGLVDHGNFWGSISQMLSLRHGNIVQLQAVCIHHAQCWFVYEQPCVQRSLDMWVDNSVDKVLKPLDGEACFRVAVGVAYGLQYLHSRNISLSVTTKNILLNERFEPQILINSLVCEEKHGLADYQRRSDVVHFRELIGKLLLHMDSNGLYLNNTPQCSRPSSLKEVELFCLEDTNVSMDEVVDMLEANICHLHDSLHVNSRLEDMSAELPSTLFQSSFQRASSQHHRVPSF